MDQKYKIIILVMSAVILLLTIVFVIHQYAEPTAVDRQPTRDSRTDQEILPKTPQGTSSKSDQVKAPVGYKAYTHEASGVSFFYQNFFKLKESIPDVFRLKSSADTIASIAIVFSSLENYDTHKPTLAEKKVLTQSTFLGECPPEIAGDLQEKRHDKCVVTTTGKNNIRAIERWDEDIEGTPEDEFRIMQKTYTIFAGDYRILFAIEIETFAESINNFTNPEYINFSFEPYQTGSSIGTDSEKLKALQQFDNIIASISLVNK